MRSVAKFEIIGRIGGVEHHDNVSYLQIAANYRKKVGEDWSDDTYWNRVTVFNESYRKYIAEHVKIGDLVRAVGKMRDVKFEVNGQTRFATDRRVDEFGLLARAADAE
jgi:single-stranded DNA-binding protein